MTPERWQRIENLLQSALERKPGERAAFLDEACLGDNDLRREVESLLASNEQVDKPLKSPALEDAARMLAGDKTNSLLGQRIGSYQIISQLGAGGMGEVYLAQDSRLGRKVALKILPSFFTKDEQRLRRFQQEARAASALNHPNIITLFDFGQVDSIHFIATEYVEGRTLRAALSGRKMQLVQAIDVAVQVASALAAAHHAGIVHRDIKPENVMLRPDGYVKVLDFGLAKLTQTPESHDGMEALTLAMDTDPGTVMGTASYMSPEQARGQSVDARTDIFSLGVVLYEMVAGRVPFDGDTTSDVIAAILVKQPPPLVRYDPDASAEMQRIVTKALRKQKDERYQTIKEMLGALKDLKQGLDAQARIERGAAPELRSGATVTAIGEPATARATAQNEDVTVRSTSNAEYLVGQINRHRRGAALALAASLIALAATAYSFYFAGGNKTEIHSIAVLPFTNVGADPDAEYLSDGITESLINSLSKLSNVRVTARTTAFTFKGRSVDPFQAGRELKVDALLTGRVTQRGDALNIQVDLISVADGSQMWGEQYNRKFSDILAIQGELAREISGKLSLQLSGAERELLAKQPTENTEAYELYLRGYHSLYKFTDEGFKKSLDYFEQAIAKDPSYAVAYAGLAEAYLDSTTVMEAAEASTRAKNAAQKAVALDASLAEAHYALALVSFQYDLDWPAAEREFKLAIKLKPSYALAYDWYGFFLGMLGRFDEAYAQFKRGLQIDPLSLPLNADLATCYYWQRRYDQAIEQFRKALDLDPNFPPALQYLAQTYAAMGQYAKALQEFEKIASSTTAFGAQGFIGYVYAKSGRRSDAERVLAKLQEQAKTSNVASDALAVAYTGLGEKDKAFQAWQSSCRRVGSMQAVKVDPIFDDLRSDPRFPDLVRCVGLTP